MTDSTTFPATAGASPGAGEGLSRAELRVTMEFLGLRQSDLASILTVTERTVRHWLAGTYRIPVGVGEDLEQVERFTAACVGEYVAALSDRGEVGVLTYERDEDLWSDRPDFAPYPASWHRAVIARVAHEIPGLEIAYAPEAQS